MHYEKVKNINANVFVHNISRKKLHVFECVFLCLFLVSVVNIGSIRSSVFSGYVHNIISKWTTQQEDIGKIKFVNYFQNNIQENGVFLVASPFKNYYATNVSAVRLEVFGLGDPVVVAPINGIVKKITQHWTDGRAKYDMVIAGDNVEICLFDLDYVCAKEHDNVSKNQKIAVSEKSKIYFEIHFNGVAIELPSAGVNDTFFE